MPADIKELIFFVTSRCNMRCHHCFNWKNLHAAEDLTIEEIADVAKTLGGLKRLSLSGGEPFLRQDLPELCALFSRSGVLTNINIPTNGYLSDTIIEMAVRILTFVPTVEVSIRISLEGLEEYHDRNRDTVGAFTSALDTARRLLALKRRYSNLRVGVSSTLTQDNPNQVLALNELVKAELPRLDSFYWGVLRGTPADSEVPVPTLKTLEHVDFKILADNGKEKPWRYFMNAFESEFYAVRRRALSGGGLPFPCVAGKNIVVLSSNGDVAPCELLAPVGNIKDKSLDNLLSSSEFLAVQQRIETTGCFCTHECFIFPSLVEHYQTHKLRFYRKYLLTLVRTKLAKWIHP